MRSLFLIGFLIGMRFFAIGQDWNWAQRFGGSGTETLASMTIDSMGLLTLAGNYSETIDFGVVELNAVAGGDAFLLRLDDTGSVRWGVSAGSTNNDLSIDVEVDQAGNTVWLGQYWVQAFFEQDTIFSGSSSKAYFLAKYDPNGVLIWVQSINGSKTKEVNDLTINAQNEIYITGHFEDQLFVGDTTLMTDNAADAFVAKFRADGTTLWARNYGDSGSVEAQRIEQLSTGELVISGHLEGGVTFAADTLVSVVTDLDIFVALLETDGTPRWGRIGRGVFNNINRALFVDAADQIYLSGDFVGVLLIEGVELRTPDFIQNIYLIKLDATGNLLWARDINQQVFNDASFGLDLAVRSNQVLLTGQFQGDLIIDELSLNSDGQAKGFIAGFEAASGQVKQLSKIAGTSLTLGTQIAVSSNDLVHIAGGNFETVFFDELSLASAGEVDFFVAQATPLFTNLVEPLKGLERVSIYPNPAGDYLRIDSSEEIFKVMVFDTFGRFILSVENQKTLNLQGLVPGQYQFFYQSARQSGVLPVLKL